MSNCNITAPYYSLFIIQFLIHVFFDSSLSHINTANGKAFADSYLRFEDYLCYMSNALNKLGNALKGMILMTISHHYLLSVYCIDTLSCCMYHYILSIYCIDTLS